jgi:hypothetical protein
MPATNMLRQAKALLKDIPLGRRVDAYSHYLEVIKREAPKDGTQRDAFSHVLSDGGRSSFRR